MEDEGESSQTMLADMERTVAANARMLALADHPNIASRCSGSS